MSTTGNVQITINDNGGATNIIVAAPSVIAVAGTSSAGTVGVPVSTRSLATITSTFGYGPLSELCALLISAGATVIATKLTTAVAGSASAVTFAGTGSSAVTVSGAAFDTYYVVAKVITGGTIGSAGITLQISLDAGRTFGPVIALDVASNYAIPQTGLTINFGAGTLVAGDTATFGTVAPAPNAAGVNAWLNAMLASPYAAAGWGSMIVAGSRTGADVTSVQATLDTLAAQYLFERLIFNSRDVSPAAKWGGTGETESTWQNALLNDFSATSARRSCVSAGYYNMPSGIANPAAGTPRYRRPLSWAIAARKVQQPVQVLSSRVKDGTLAAIIVDPTNDPTDGFIYHDERINPGLDAGRFASAWTRLGQPQGFFVRSENLMSPLGSDFPLLAVGQCFDNFCSALVQFFTANIDDSVRTNSNGTIYENDAQRLESGALSAVASSMTGQYQPQNTSVVIDRTYNVKTNSKVLVSGTFGGLAYVREFDLTVQVQNPNAA
ncbi:MAG: hypothetical protein RIS45_1104 [Planctomycetota bacterium]|jgi:hypothetical protein